jgi:hypothetical protein
MRGPSHPPPNQTGLTQNQNQQDYDQVSYSSTE